jgi:hypothetical protein
MKLNLQLDIAFQLIASIDCIVASILDFYQQNLESTTIFFVGLFFFVLGGLSSSKPNTSFNLELVENKSNEWKIKFSKLEGIKN